MALLAPPAASNTHTWTHSTTGHKGGILLKTASSFSPAPGVATHPPAGSHNIEPVDPALSPPTSDRSLDSSITAPHPSPPPSSTGSASATSAPRLIVGGAAVAPQSGATEAAGTSIGRARRIKFAPLPDPRHPRRNSTGADLISTATLGPGGERTVNLERRSDAATAVSLNDDDDEDTFDDDDLDDEEDERRRKGASSRRRSWTNKILKPMGLGSSSSSTGSASYSSAGDHLRPTRSLDDPPTDTSNSWSFSSLTRVMSPGEPSSFVSSGRRSSSSNGSLSAAEERQSKLLASLSPTRSSDSQERLTSPGRGSGGSASGHRLSASLGNASALSTSSNTRSPIGMRLLNGNVYGRAADEARRKANDEALRGPEFKEWSSSGGMGSNSTPGDDSDNGEGMSWVRRRRQAREQAEREAAEAAARAPPTVDMPLVPDAAIANSSMAHGTTQTVEDPTVDSVVPPILLTTASHQDPDSLSGVPQPVAPPTSNPSRTLTGPATPLSAPTQQHLLESYTIPGHHHSPSSANATPPSGLAAAGVSSHATTQPIAIGRERVIPGLVDDDSEDDSESEEDEEDRDNDDDDDDEDSEDERLQEEARKTAQCAGVEVLARHKSREAEA